jgi:predicted Zn-dependent protease
MQISGKNIAVLVLVPVAALAFLILFVNSAISASMNIRDLVVSEHADESQKLPSVIVPNATSTLIIKSYWNKDTVTIGLFTNDLDPVKSQQIIRNVTNEISFFNQTLVNAGSVENGTTTTLSPVIYDTWASLLKTMQDRESSKLPTLKIVDDDASRQNADVKIYFEVHPHPEGRGLGVATATYDGQTLETASVEIHIYQSYQLYEEGILGAVLRHELGHSLGLGHSTSMTSIMYNRVVIVNDKVVGVIGECESDALDTAYVQNEIKDISCKIGK